jgi:surface protein
MESEILSKDKNKDNPNDISSVKLKNIKSNYILSKIYINLVKKKSLQIFQYNKKLQNRLNLDIKNYKEYYEAFMLIEIEIIPCSNKYGEFININEKDKIYYHIYFNDNKEETKNIYLIKKENNVKKIKIIIDHQIKSFAKLFQNCKCIELIKFEKFYRNNINNMSKMFIGCSSLIKIDISNFNTNNVTDMSGMFCGCILIKELNLSNFNTNNVKDMRYMFCGCTSLVILNLSNFNTNNVTNMGDMFSNCYSLKKINLSSFNTSSVTDMSCMFYGCSSIKELNISNFNTNNVKDMRGIFSGCSIDLNKKIYAEIKNIKDEAFEFY